MGGEGTRERAGGDLFPACGQARAEARAEAEANAQAETRAEAEAGALA